VSLGTGAEAQDIFVSLRGTKEPLFHGCAIIRGHSRSFAGTLAISPLHALTIIKVGDGPSSRQEQESNHEVARRRLEFLPKCRWAQGLKPKKVPFVTRP
jgi:hypothetical protein